MSSNDAYILLAAAYAALIKKKRNKLFQQPRIRIKWMKEWLLNRSKYTHINLLEELRLEPDNWQNYLGMDEDKATPLFIAAQNGHYKILVYLLAQGAEPDSKRTDGATPLWIAAQMGHDHIVAQLLRAGARVDSARHLHYKDENEKSKDKKKKMSKTVKEYLDDCEALRQKINEIKNDTREVNYTLLNKQFYKFEDLKNEVNPIIKRSENACTQIHNKLKDMAIEREELEKESSAETKMKYMQYTTLREEFQDAINSHIECVKRYEVLLEEIKKRIQQSIQGENYNESEDISNEGQAFIGNYLIEKHAAELQLRDVQERHHQLLEIENQLVELRELFVKIAILVEQQVGCLL
ncbi:ankyrin repeat family protein [Holotrichia oblita]|uniref:Ankyrin repeat family protein n=1 Tax=Holotrichia oblita TaxID=644536 RepID=A0ACB9T3Q2_HOLOL|nr:ankyrin repeat family protein [Holotrichia oblita]